MDMNIETLEALNPTERLKVLRDLSRAKDPLFNRYMEKSADIVIEQWGDLNRHMEDIVQDHCEGAYIEVSHYDKIKQALFAVDPTSPALKSAPPNYGVWEQQRNRIAKLEAVVAAARLVAEGPRTDDRFFYGIKASKRVMEELDAALKELGKT